jgi:hypothetical protein
VVQRLRAVLTDGVAEGATSTALQQALSDPAAPAILIIHERMVNLPPQLVPPLHRCLQDDIRKMLNSKVSRSIADTRPNARFSCAERNVPHSHSTPACPLFGAKDGGGKKRSDAKDSKQKTHAGLRIVFAPQCSEVTAPAEAPSDKNASGKRRKRTEHGEFSKFEDEVFSEVRASARWR